MSDNVDPSIGRVIYRQTSKQNKHVTIWGTPEPHVCKKKEKNRKNTAERHAQTQWPLCAEDCSPEVAPQCCEAGRRGASVACASGSFGTQQGRKQAHSVPSTASSASTRHSGPGCPAQKGFVWMTDVSGRTLLSSSLSQQPPESWCSFCITLGLGSHSFGLPGHARFALPWRDTVAPSALSGSLEAASCT